MSELAQRLNELAAANDDGLIDDDEYRLLRQALFERYATTPSLAVETAIAPLSLLNQNSAPPLFPISGQYKHVEFHRHAVPERSPDTPLAQTQRPKQSVAAGVASFIRKATGRKVSPSTSGKEPQPAAPLPSHAANSFKRVFSPRSLTKKLSNDVLSIRSDSSRARNGSVSDSRSFTSRNTSLGSPALSPPTSPVRSLPSDSMLQSPWGEFSDSIFDDGGLSTSKQIRQVMLETEAKGKKLLEAFDQLESSALIRLQRQNNADNYTLRNRQDNLSTTLTGVAASSQSILDASTRRSVGRNTGVGRRPSLASFVSPIASIKRKNSLSSISSQATSTLSFGGIARTSSSLSRSTGHLPLGSLPENTEHDISSVSEDLQSEGLAEIADIRRRRIEVSGRYQARLEYLRARLKGAELHEKLIRR